MKWYARWYGLFNPAIFHRTLLILGLPIFGIITILIFIQGPQTSQAVAQGLAASFIWSGQGSSVVQARVSNESYTGPKPARVVYGIYWCAKGGTNDCAPDFSGDKKAAETLTFQTIDLSIPNQGQTQTVSLPNISALASKTCGRFQVDLGLETGGIVGGQVFSIGSDCLAQASPPPASPKPVTCPYSSTQAQVQQNSSDPWDDAKTVTIGESVNLGGFHESTGRFTGDSANTYSPNKANVDFIITEPGGGASVTLTPPYPINYTPKKIGTYSFVGKTLKDVNDRGAGYFSESACTDSGSIIVKAKPPSPSPVIRATPTPSPKASASPRATPRASPRPTSTPKATPQVSPHPRATPSPTAQASPSPVSDKTQLKLCKFEDDDGDGVKDSSERVLSWKFMYTVAGESTKTVESHWWNILTQGCAVVDVPADREIRVEEEMRSGWRLTALYNDGTKTDQTSLTYDSDRDRVKVVWFLNTFTPIGGPDSTPSPSVSPSPSASPVSGNIQPECIALSATPSFGGAELNVSFTGKGRDEDGRIERLEFDFGDGANQTVDVNGETNKVTLASVSHTYRNPGTYGASLRVRDNSGQSNEWSTTRASCKVKIEVEGVVLAEVTTSQVTTLPKAGVSELLVLWYGLSGVGGISLKLLSKKLKQIV